MNEVGTGCVEIMVRTRKHYSHMTKFTNLTNAWKPTAVPVQTVSLSSAISSQFILKVCALCTAAEDRKNQ